MLHKCHISQITEKVDVMSLSRGRRLHWKGKMERAASAKLKIQNQKEYNYACMLSSFKNSVNICLTHILGY